MFIQMKKLGMEGVKNTDNMESQGDPLNATRDIVELHQSAFRASSGEFISGKVSGEPSARTASKAPKKRLMRSKEVAVSAANKKRKQDVSIYSGAAVGVKVNAPRTGNMCGCCKRIGNHAITRCDRRGHFKTLGAECNVADPNGSSALTERLLSSPPCDMTLSQPSSFASKLSTEQIKSSHALVHHKHALAAGSVASINNFAFVVSIIVGGEVDLRAKHIQISGALMNQIITNVSTGNKPTPKFIYDATVPVCQSTMMNMSQPMMSLSQLSQQEGVPALPDIGNTCSQCGDNDYGVLSQV